VLNNTKTQSRPKLLFLVPLLVKPIKVLKILKTFLSRPRPRPRLLPQDQDQDSGSQDQDQDFIFCPRGASRPRLWSRGLHHWFLLHWRSECSL